MSSLFVDRIVILVGDIFEIDRKDVSLMNLPLPEPFINFAWEPNGDKFAVLTGNQNKATPNVYKIDAKSVTPLKLISKIDAGVQFNELQCAPSGQWLAVLAKLSSGGNVMFVDTTLQEAKRTNVIEHPGFNKSYWDPTGRYFVTCTTVGGRIGTDLGYRIFTFQGRELHRKNLDRLSQFQWRPRPPVRGVDTDKKELALEDLVEEQIMVALSTEKTLAPVSDDDKINSLRLAEISLPVARFIYEKNRQEAYDFLGKIAKTVQKDKMAVARIHSGEIELRLLYKDNQDRVYDIAVVRNMLESTQKEIDEMVGVTEVHAPFYKVSAQYLKEIGDYAGYYREALRYLGVEDINRLTPDEKYSQALLVGFAALLGENVYNFGELLCHPILNVLKGTGERWLVEVLDAFNSGDLNKFYALEKDWSVWNDLKKDREYLVAKLRLMSIMEIALARPSKERNIPFKEIAAKCQIQVNDVEFLVMKALSKGLIQGCIDQVNQTVLITWVQPRVLNPQQILSMADRINAWRADVASMENVVNDHAKEILTKTTEKSLLA